MNSVVQRNLYTSSDANPQKQPSDCKKNQCLKPESSERLQRAVAVKLEDGSIRGAIRLLASKDQIAQSSQEVIETLKVSSSNTHLSLKT